MGGSPPPSPKVTERSIAALPPPTSPVLTQNKFASKSKADIFPKVLDYVFSKLKTCTKGKEVEATRQAKDYWKQKSNLPSNEFKELWNKIKETVSKKVKKDKNMSLNHAITNVDSNVMSELGKTTIMRRSSSITSIDSNIVRELKRSNSTTSIDLNVQNERKRSNSITSIDSTSAQQREVKRSISKSSIDLGDEISTPTTNTSEIKKRNSLKQQQQQQKTESSNNDNDPWASLWMPNYHRNSETFML